MRGKYVGGATPMGPEGFLPVAFVLGYLLGSMPFGLIVPKLARTPDPPRLGLAITHATSL